MDSIAFEEWALKSLDKELSPKLWSSTSATASVPEEETRLMDTQAGKATPGGGDAIPDDTVGVLC